MSRTPLALLTLSLLIACGDEPKTVLDDSGNTGTDTGSGADSGDTDTDTDDTDPGEDDKPTYDEIWLQDCDVQLIGEAISDAAGVSVTATGDVDGDGLPDMAVGSNFNDGAETWTGAIYVLTEIPETGSSLSESNHKIIGASENDRIGDVVDSAGDVDGDGRADLLIGGPLDSTMNATGGALYLMSAEVITSDDLVDTSAADAVIYGTGILERLGSGVAGLDDVDGDGAGDIALGAKGNDLGGDERGTVFLLSGADLLEMESGTVEDLLIGFTGVDDDNAVGDIVADGGDIDGDGLSDLMVGYPGHEDDPDSMGTTYLLYSSSAIAVADGIESLDDADWIWEGEGGGDFSGTGIASAGDVDDDGLGDVMIGAPRVNGIDGPDDDFLDSGAVYLLLGGGALVGSGGTDDLGWADMRMDGDEWLLDCGTSLNSAGDVDGDGRQDMFLGTNSADYSTTWSGPTYLVTTTGLLAEPTGVVSLMHAQRTYRSNVAKDYPGHAQVGIGDRNGDGLGELAFGAYGYDHLVEGEQRVDTGTLFLFYGE